MQRPSVSRVALVLYLKMEQSSFPDEIPFKH